LRRWPPFPARLRTEAIAASALKNLRVGFCDVAAVSSGLSVAGFMLTVVDDRPAPMIDLAQVAEIASAVAALAAVPGSVRDLEADLGRLSGRLSHLFTVNYARASLHRDEIHETLYALQDLMRRVLPEIAKMSAAVAEPRTEIATVMRAIARELASSRANRRTDIEVIANRAVAGWLERRVLAPRSTISYARDRSTIATTSRRLRSGVRTWRRSRRRR